MRARLIFNMATNYQRFKIEAKRKKDNCKSPRLRKTPQARGWVNRITFTTPRKPNSAKRPIAKVYMKRWTIYKLTAHLPGIGHTLKKYSKVIIRGRGPRDLPGVGYSCIRGVLDFMGLDKKKRRRSIYGSKPTGDFIKRVRKKYRKYMWKTERKYIVKEKNEKILFKIAENLNLDKVIRYTIYFKNFFIKRKKISTKFSTFVSNYKIYVNTIFKKKDQTFLKLKFFNFFFFDIFLCFFKQINLYFFRINFFFFLKFKKFFFFKLNFKKVLLSLGNKPYFFLHKNPFIFFKKKIKFNFFFFKFIFFYKSFFFLLNIADNRYYSKKKKDFFLPEKFLIKKFLKKLKFFKKLKKKKKYWYRIKGLRLGHFKKLYRVSFAKNFFFLKSYNKLKKKNFFFLRLKNSKKNFFFMKNQKKIASKLYNNYKFYKRKSSNFLKKKKKNNLIFLKKKITKFF